MLMLEVLIAILIFSLGILGVVGLQATMIATSINAEDRTQAALLANELVSSMWTRGTTSLLAADIDSWKARVAGASPSSARLSASGDVSVDASNMATITITWKAPSKKTSEYANRYVTQVVLP